MKLKITPNPAIADVRTVRKFLWFPKSFPGDTERRWLEFANIDEQFEIVVHEEICEQTFDIWRRQEKKWIEIGWSK